MTATNAPVPFLDLGPMHERLKAEVVAGVSTLIDTGAFTNGPEVAAFEGAFAAYCASERCVGLANGLDALRLGLIALGIEPGDEVVVPAMTFAATFEAVLQAGGVPIPVDIREDDYCLEPDGLAAAAGPRTRFVIPVHLYGQLADMVRIRALARAHRLLVLEDACQAHGAEREGLRAGAAGDAAAFSFYPSKNLGAMGDAGAFVSNDREVAERVLSLREHGETVKYQHEQVGYTARLDTVQALFLLAKLPHLDGWNEERRRVAAHYDSLLAGLGDLRLPAVADKSAPVWYLYVVRTADPAGLARFLAERGIGTGRHYPSPPHLAPAYAGLGYPRGTFPVAEALADEGLSLPIYPGITDGQVEAVAEAIREFFRSG